MDRIYNIESVEVDDTYLHLIIDGQAFRIRWKDCSPKLAKANRTQRENVDIAPSGYGIHWPEIDEDLAITPLLKRAEVVTLETA